MGILPNQILPPSAPFLNPDGTIAHDWWLWLYNVGQSALGNSNTSSVAYQAQVISDLDGDADIAGLKGVADRISALETLVSDTPDPTKSIIDRIAALEQQVLDIYEGSGFTGKIVTAKLSTANGSLTFQNGLLISEVAAT
jgi:hypothetical protein